MAKKSLFLLVMSAAIFLVLFSGCTDTTGNTGAGDDNITGEYTSAITPEVTQEVNATGTDAVAEEGEFSALGGLLSSTEADAGSRRFRSGSALHSRIVSPPSEKRPGELLLRVFSSATQWACRI